MDAISSSSFVANEIDLLLKLLAYNLIERFKASFCDPENGGRISQSAELGANYEQGRYALVNDFHKNTWKYECPLQ